MWLAVVALSRETSYATKENNLFVIRSCRGSDRV